MTPSTQVLAVMDCVVLNPRPDPAHPGMFIRVDVEASIHPDAPPGCFVDNDFVWAPQYARSDPAPRPKARSDDYGRAETDSPRNYEPGRRRPEYDHRIVRGNVDVLRIHWSDLDVITNLINGVIGIRTQIAVVVGALPKPLDSIHYIGALH